MLGYLKIILLTYEKLPEELPLKSNKQWSKLWDYFFMLHILNYFNIDERYKSWTSSLCSFLHPIVTSVLLGLNKYYAYIHSILSYGIIFWGRSSNVNKLFILQKKIVRIITNSRVRESCREALKICRLWHCIPNTFFH